MFRWASHIRRQVGRRRGVLLLTLLIALAWLVRGLSLLQNDLNRRQAAARGEDRPRYLYQSSFRNKPDLALEEQLSRAFQEIERQQLSRHDEEDGPHTIWQIMLGQSLDTFMRGDDSLKFEERNSEWKYKLVTTEWAEEFVTITLGSIPGLARLYHSYPHHVLRADLLRYLILWYYGGYYADTDVFPAKSINDCPSLQQSVFQTDTPNVSLVVGIEIDEPFASPQKMHDWHWVRSYGFIQYTLYAPRRFSPLLREIIVRVLSHTKRHVDESSFLWGAKYNELTTLEITGPGVFTDTILDILSKTLPENHPVILNSLQADEGLGDLVPPFSTIPQARVTWAPFHRITSPLCIDGSEAKPGKSFGGVCVLPINAWGNGQRHSGAENFLSAHACINHRFGGTWKPWRTSWKKYLFGK